MSRIKLNSHLLTASMLALTIVSLATAQTSGRPAGESSSLGFLTSESNLAPSKDDKFEMFYIAPVRMETAAKYRAVMIDQPELFVHPDSKYKGLKPDDMKAIADGLREAVTQELQGGAFKVVDKPGPGVLYVRLAVGDLMLQKRKRPILAYTPAGAVLYATKQAISNVTQKIDVKNMTIEGEVLDSETMQQFAAFRAKRGNAKGGPIDAANNPDASWKELQGLFTTVGKRMRCRLDNSQLPQSQWQNCAAIAS